MYRSVLSFLGKTQNQKNALCLSMFGCWLAGRFAWCWLAGGFARTSSKRATHIFRNSPKSQEPEWASY